MKVVNLRVLEGPNVYLHRPVIFMRLDLEELTVRESNQYPGFVDWLLQKLPDLAVHYCGLGRKGGFLERLQEGTYFGHVVEHVVLEMEHVLGYEVIYGKTRNAGMPNLYDVVMEIESPQVAMQLINIAIELVQAGVSGLEFDLERRLEDVQRLQAVTDLGPSTKAIVWAAKQRKIPVRRVGAHSLVQLGTGKYRKWIKATLTSQTSAVAVDIASDKELTKLLLQDAGLSVPAGGMAATLEEARHWFLNLRKPVVVKPLDGCQGQGVTLEVEQIADLEQAFYFAQKISRQVIVEEQMVGKQYRLLVVNGRLVAASERVPAHVIGDGEHSVEALIQIANLNPLRGDDHEKPLTKIPVDEFVQQFLARKNITLEQIPSAGEVVFLRDGANLSTGGIAIDVTARVHPVHASMAVKAAMVIGLDVCGVDLIAREISDDHSEAAIIEVNAAPGIRMHHFPSIGESRDVGEAIVKALFPTGSNSHVPIVSVTGTNGKTTTTRLISHILQKINHVVGMTTTDGVIIGDQKIWSGDASGPRSAHMVLSDPTVDVAVLETARGGILREGLGYDLADVAVLTNITGDHIGQDGLKTIDDIVHVKSLIAECVREGGTVVLNADDKELVKLAARIKTRIVWISKEEDNAIVNIHLKEGGQAFFTSNGWLMEGAGSLLWPIAKIQDIPLTIHGTAEFHIYNLLCAIAAARQLGVSRAICKSAVNSFHPLVHNPGRVQMYQMPSGLKVILDYGHNEDGMKAIGNMVKKWAINSVPAIIGYPGDRNDTVIEDAARMAAHYFSPIVVREDVDLRGRRQGELANLIANAVVRERPDVAVTKVLNELDSLAYALDKFSHHEVLVMFFEKLAPLVKMIENHGGQEISLMQVSREIIQAR